MFENYIGAGVEELWESKILLSSLGIYFGGFHQTDVSYILLDWKAVGFS